MIIKKLKKTTALVLTGLALGISSAFSQNTSGSEMTEAVLKVYQQELNENPKNYNVYFRRAHLLYGMSQYLRALSDVDNAIKYTPASDSDLLSQEYALRSNIYMMLDKQEDALADISRAYELDRSSYAYLYQKANLEYALEKYAEAKEDYKRLQQFKNRSLESLIGLARVAVKENNLGLANEYIDQAISLYPAESEAYLRRASVRSLMGNNNGAVDDILMALSIDKKSGRPFNELLRMSHNDYNAVISGLSGAISKAPETALFYYIRAVIAQAHYHYGNAAADYETILNRNLYNSANVHSGLAECYYALCRYDKALHEINTAIGYAPDNAAFHVTLSKIRLAMGDAQVALKAADDALGHKADNINALEQRGLCYVALRNYEAASNQFGEVIMTDADAIYPYLVRGWILKNYLGKNADAVSFFARAADIENDKENIRSFYPFALFALGQTDEALALTRAALEKKDIDGYAHYLGACLYSQAGLADEAFDALRTAFTLGYANLNAIRNDSVGYVNLAPIRNDGRFDQLIKSYSYLFEY